MRKKASITSDIVDGRRRGAIKWLGLATPPLRWTWTPFICEEAVTWLNKGKVPKYFRVRVSTYKTAGSKRVWLCSRWNFSTLRWSPNRDGSRPTLGALSDWLKTFYRTHTKVSPCGTEMTTVFYASIVPARKK